MVDEQLDNSNQQNPVDVGSVQVKQQTSALAVASLVLGILAVLGAVVPLLNIGAVPFALVGLALAIAGYRSVRNGKRSGRGIAIAGAVLGIVSLVVIGGMYGCAGLIASSSNTGSSASSSAVSASASSSGANASASGVELEKSRTTVGPTSFNLPKGWAAEKDSKGRTFYYPSKSDHSSLFYLASEKSSIPSGQSESEYLNAYVNGIVSSMGTFNTVDSQDVEISGCVAKRAKASGTLKGRSESFTLQMIAVSVPGNVITIAGGSTKGQRDSEIAACLDTFEIDVAAVPSADAEASDDSPKGEDGAVSPELKDALDSYEAFMDEYIAFMERYKNSGDITSMLADYGNYMQQYADATAKMNAIDSNSLSAADYAYYIEVTSRVSQKLLSASL